MPLTNTAVTIAKAGKKQYRMTDGQDMYLLVMPTWKKILAAGLHPLRQAQNIRYRKVKYTPLVWKRLQRNTFGRLYDKPLTTILLHCNCYYSICSPGQWYGRDHGNDWMGFGDDFSEQGSSRRQQQVRNRSESSGSPWFHPSRHLGLKTIIYHLLTEEIRDED